jgi:hypothetical protein
VLLTASGRAPVYHKPAALRPARLGRGSPAPSGGARLPVGGVAAGGAVGSTFTRRAMEADWGLRPCRRCWPRHPEGRG